MALRSSSHPASSVRDNCARSRRQVQPDHCRGAGAGPGRPLLGVTPKQRACGSGCGMARTHWRKSIARIAAACLHFGITPQEIEGRLFVDSGRNQPIVIATQTRNGATIARPMVEALVAEIIDDNQIDVVSIDPFISSQRGAGERQQRASIGRQGRGPGSPTPPTPQSTLRTIRARPAAPRSTVEDGRGRRRAKPIPCRSAVRALNR